MFFNINIYSNQRIPELWGSQTIKGKHSRSLWGPAFGFGAQRPLKSMEGTKLANRWEISHPFRWVVDMYPHISLIFINILIYLIYRYTIYISACCLVAVFRSNWTFSFGVGLNTLRELTYPTFGKGTSSSKSSKVPSIWFWRLFKVQVQSYIKPSHIKLPRIMTNFRQNTKGSVDWLKRFWRSNESMELFPILVDVRRIFVLADWNMF